MTFPKYIYSPILIIIISFISSCGVIYSSSSDMKLRLDKVKRSKDKNLYFFSIKNRGPDFEIQGIEIYNDSGLDLVDYIPESFSPPNFKKIESKQKLKFSFALDHQITEFKFRLRSKNKRYIELNFIHN
jgi:hypothetical protein